MKNKLLYLKLINKGVKVIRKDEFYPLSRKLKIIIFKLDHLGDFILAIPAIMKLKEIFQYSDCDIVVGAWNVAMAKRLSVFRDVVVYNCFKNNSSEAPEANQITANKLFSTLGHYDIAIDLRRQPDTRFLMKKISATIKVGYKSFSEYDNELDICLDTELDEVGVIKKPNTESIAMQMLRAIDAIPLEIIQLPALVHYKPVDRQIAIFPFAGNNVREWPLGNFLELIEKIIKEEIASAINVYMPAGKKLPGIALNNINILSGLPTDELIKSLSANCLAISNNSFGAHVSSYIGIPLIGIYGGQETIQEWAPPFNKSTIIHSDVSCSPCHIPDIKDCPHDLVCLQQITPKFVLDVVRKQLQEEVDINMNRYFNYIKIK